MVLVDTSVWIRSFANRAPYAGELDSLLALDQVARHDLVYGELLTGDKGGRQEFFASYERIYRAGTVAHGEAVYFVRNRKLAGRGIGWIDVHLLASALIEGMSLWTADARLADIAAELGVRYRGTA